MKLEVVHKTRYGYAAPVRDSFNELRVRPQTNAQQECERFLLRVLPAVRLRHYLDLHSNHVNFFELAEPHQSLEIECRSLVHTTSPELPASPRSRSSAPPSARAWRIATSTCSRAATWT